MKNTEPNLTLDGAGGRERPLPAEDGAAKPEDDAMTPLPGEAGIPNIAGPGKRSFSKKGLFAVALLLVSLVAVGAVSVQRLSASLRKPNTSDAALTRDKPAAASAEPHRLDIPSVSPAPSQLAPTQQRTDDLIVPALVPTAEELDEPIGVHRTGSGNPASTGPTGTRPPRPEDAPLLLVSARPGPLPSPDVSLGNAHPDSSITGDMGTLSPEDPRDPMAATSRNLQAYQRRLQGLMDGLTQATTTATANATATNGPGPAPASAVGGLLGSELPTFGRQNPSSSGGAGLFGGQLQGSATPKVMASRLGNRSLTLPKGTAFACALKTKVISAASGLVGCEVQRNLYGEDGRVLLIERGSHLDGEYRIAAVKPGTVRIPIIWTRVRTPLGVTVDLDSPGTGQLGESGIDGYVDNRWSERIGAAMLLSLIDDSVKLVLQSQTNERQADTVVLPSTTENTSKLAEKVLDSTINIPPLIYQNQGGIVGIYVARDVDFSSVYELQPIAPEHAGEAPR